MNFKQKLEVYKGFNRKYKVKLKLLINSLFNIIYIILTFLFDLFMFLKEWGAFFFVLHCKIFDFCEQIYFKYYFYKISLIAQMIINAFWASLSFPFDQQKIHET